MLAGKLLLGKGDEPEAKSGRRLPVSETSENCPFSNRTPLTARWLRARLDRCHRGVANPELALALHEPSTLGAVCLTAKRGLHDAAAVKH